MFDLTCKHIVHDIQNKRTDGEPNKYREQVLGKPCYLPEEFSVGYGAVLMIGPQPDDDWEKVLWTSAVEKYTVSSDGTAVLETANSIYTFKPIDGGGSNDLP